MKTWANLYHLPQALDYYQLAKDNVSIVRVLCFHDKLDAASEVVMESGDAAAAYHLAKKVPPQPSHLGPPYDTGRATPPFPGACPPHTL